MDTLSSYLNNESITPPSDVAYDDTGGWLSGSALRSITESIHRGGEDFALILGRLIAARGYETEEAANLVYDMSFYIIGYDIFGTLTFAASLSATTSSDSPTLYFVLPHPANYRVMVPHLIATPSATATSGFGSDLLLDDRTTSETLDSGGKLTQIAADIIREQDDAARSSFNAAQYYNWLLSLNSAEQYAIAVDQGMTALEMLRSASLAANDYLSGLEEISSYDTYLSESGVPENSEGTRLGASYLSQLEDQLTALETAEFRQLGFGEDEDEYKELAAEIEEIRRRMIDLSAEYGEILDIEGRIDRNEYSISNTDVENTSLNYGTSIQEVMSNADNARFNLSSANLFASAVEAQVDESATTMQSFSAYEALGIIVNRPKIILVSDYDLGINVDAAASAGLNSEEYVSYNASMDYISSKHDIVKQYYENKILPDADGLASLEEEYNLRVNSVVNSISYIKRIDEYKESFISSITDYPGFDMGMIGYPKFLNPTRAIRQAFYDLSHTSVSGGLFLFNRLHDIYETPDGLSSTAARLLSTKVDPGYKAEGYGAGMGILSELVSSNSNYKNILVFEDTLRAEDGFTEDDLTARVSSNEMNQHIQAAGANSLDYLFGPVPFELDGRHSASNRPMSSSQKVQEFIGTLSMAGVTRAVYYGNSPAAAMGLELQSIYAAMMNSYLISTTDAQDAPGKGQEFFDPELNILKEVLGDACSTRSLAEVDTTQKLGQLLKYRMADTTVYPFEKPGLRYNTPKTDDSGRKGEGDAASGIEMWFDKNIGNIIEGRPTDFRGLDTFVQSFEDLLTESERLASPFGITGHGQLIINEILSSIKKIFTGDLMEIHPQTGYSDTKGGGGMGFSANVNSIVSNVQFTDPKVVVGDAVNAGGEALAADSDGVSDSETSDYEAEAQADEATADVMDGNATEEDLEEGGGCLLPGSEILTDAGLVPVESIRIGDRVYSYDFENQSYGYFSVTAVMTPRHRKKWAKVKTRSGKILRCSIDHPLYTLERENNELPIQEAAPGTQVFVFENGKLHKDIVEEINIIPQSVTVYNFTVEKVHSYISDSILSHNKVMAGNGANALDEVFDDEVKNLQKQFSDGKGTENFQVQGASMSTSSDIYPSLEKMPELLAAMDNNIIGESRQKFVNKVATLLHIAFRYYRMTNPEHKSMLLWGSCVGEVSEVYASNTSSAASAHGTVHQQLVRAVWPTADNSGDYGNVEDPTKVSDFEARAIMIHMQELINAVCADVEKNVAYNIAVLANDAGLSPRSVGSYSDQVAVQILNSIFPGANGKMGLLYGTELATSVQVLSPTTHKTRATDDVPGTSDGFSGTVRHHIELRHAILSTIGYLGSKILADLPDPPFIATSMGDMVTQMMVASARPMDRVLASAMMVPHGFTAISSDSLSPASGGISSEAEEPKSEEFGITRKLMTSSLVHPLFKYNMVAFATHDGLAGAVDSATYFENDVALEATLAKMFLPVVENSDPDAGAVRWKLTQGLWTETGFSLEAEDFVNREFVPSSISDIVSAGTSAITDEVMIDLGVTLTNDEQDNFVRGLRQYYNFLLSPDDIRPYTFVDEKELPIYSYSIDPLRGPLSSLIKACVFQREDARRSLFYLKGVMELYKQAKEKMPLLADEAAAESLIDRATLPGIEAEEIVKYSSSRQTFLRSYLLAEESGLRNYSYVPSSKYTDSNMANSKFVRILNEMLSDNSLLSRPLIDFFNNSDVFSGGRIHDPSTSAADRATLLNTLDEKYHQRFNAPAPLSEDQKYSLLNKGRIVTLGLPAGFIDYNQNNNPLNVYERFVSLRQINNHLFTAEGQTTRDIIRVFWPSLFINRAEIFTALADPSVDNYYSLMQQIKYGHVDPNTALYSLESYATTRDKIINITSQRDVSSMSSAESTLFSSIDFSPDPIIANHVLDAMLEIYLQIYGGINTTESSFSVNSESNILYLDQTAMDSIDSLLAYAGIEDAAHILDDNKIIPFNAFYQKQSSASSLDQAYEIYSNFVCLIQNRLYSADQMSTMVLVPNIFDRTFNIFSHMGQLINESSAGVVSLFDLEDEVNETKINSLSNDYNSQIYFKADVT